MEVDPSKQPAEGEVVVFTTGGGFVVKGGVREVASKLNAEEWPDFELAESNDRVVIRSSQVVALRGGTHRRRGTIGFVHRDD